jgi:peptidoglycan/LPS O-acetylase OafA/YrhL
LIGCDASAFQKLNICASICTNKMNQKLYFQNLDGLRFFAFFFVFMFHCYYEVPEQGRDKPFYLIFHKLWENGDLGVNFFFTLSGFLITYLLLSEEGNNGGFSIKGFYWRRTLRIWPLYFTTVLFGFFVFQALVNLVGGQIEETANIWYYLLFLGNFNSIYNGDPVSGSLSVLWSLAIEEQFYLFWPILLLIFKRNRPGLFFILILVSLGFRVANLNTPDVIFYHTLSVMSDLIIGSWLGWWCFKKKMRPLEMNSMPRLYIGLIYLVGFLLILFRKQLFIHPSLMIPERIIFALFFLFIIYEQTYFKDSLYKAGRFQIISYLGKLTYGLYCLHIPAMVFTEGFAMLGEFHDSAWWIFYGKTISTFLLSLILSLISFRYLEKPFLRLKNKTFSRISNDKITSENSATV